MVSFSKPALRLNDLKSEIGGWLKIESRITANNRFLDALLQDETIKSIKFNLHYIQIQNLKFKNLFWS